MISEKKRDILSRNIPNNTLILMEGKSEQIRNGDVFYPFRQDSDFLILTGLDIPDLRLIGMRKDGEMKWILYSDPISEKEQLWGTSRLSYDELRELSGITDIREMRYFHKDKKICAEEIEHIYLKGNHSRRGVGSSRAKIQPLESLLRDLRMIKLPEEVEKIRQAIAITKRAYEHIRAIIKPGMYEYEIEAEIARVFRSHHATEAYPTIVASGVNACTLHYTRLDRKVLPGELVLVDFGAEYEGYASDITRVFAVSGVYSPRQREVYESVLSVKAFALTQIKPGVKKSDYEKSVREKMNAELSKLGLYNHLCKEGAEGNEAGDFVSGIPEQNPQSLHESSFFLKELPETTSRKYYPHSTSHFLGLDVHDTGERDEVFAPGMVITCEPGIYIPEEGIGIRLEDDILVTEGGYENLSKDIPL